VMLSRESVRTSWLFLPKERMTNSRELLFEENIKKEKVTKEMATLGT